MSKIEHSKHYNNFQFIAENRKISDQLVKTLAEDPTFPDCIPFHPIIVDENFRIVDGQHRFLACKRLGIPVYYVVQPGAALDAIRRYNTQQKIWTDQDYKSFYLEQGLEDYIFIDVLMRAHSLSLGYALNAISRLQGVDRGLYTKQYRNGEIRIDDKKVITDFFEIYSIGFSALKEYQKIEEYNHLKSRDYLWAFVDLYKENRKRFEHFMNRLPLIFNSLPVVNKMTDAKKFVEKAADKRLKTH